MTSVAGGAETAGAKEAARAVVDGELDGLVRLSHTIHAHPETAFEEEQAARWTTELLAEHGLEVTSGVGGLPTAFTARAGSGPLTVAVCAEYDALPGVGHACGHNIIAASAVGAGLALAAMADDLGITVEVIGTPAEEGGGGKAILLEEGVFDGVHAAMMVHPWPQEWLTGQCLAVAHFDVELTGREAHASAAPWRGVNAADAMVVAEVAISLSRQQLPPGDQVHGIVTNGGAAANIIPGFVTGRYMVRSRTVGGLEEARPRIERCFEAGALATGAGLAIRDLSPVYTHMEPDPELLVAYRRNAEALGRQFTLDDEGAPLPTLSTDMANVSLAVPTVHPLMAIDARGAVNHQKEFAAACITTSADRAVRDGALALARTAVDAALDPPLRSRLVAGSSR